ncbi:MAG: rod-binding protein [Pseudomonadota bacterium]
MTDITPISGVGPVAAEPRAAAPAADDRDPLRETAKAFETAYLAEMLTHAGLSKPRKSFGGGAGEDAYASLLAREWAEKIVEAGGVGVAEKIYETLAAGSGRDA